MGRGIALTRRRGLSVTWRGGSAHLGRIDALVLTQSLRITPAPAAQNLADRLAMALSLTTEVELPLFGRDLAALRAALADLLRRNHETPGIAALIRLLADE